MIATAGCGSHLVDILLVENNPNDVELTLNAFKKARFTNLVNVVRDGAEALEYIFCTGQHAGRSECDRPQVILLDLKLPKVSGVEVLRRVTSDRRTRHIPVVLLTISQDDRDMAECRRLGADNYILKPVDFHRLSRSTPRLNLDWVLLKPPEAKRRNGSARNPG